jgi:ferritin
METERRNTIAWLLHVTGTAHVVERSFDTTYQQIETAMKLIAAAQDAESRVRYHLEEMAKALDTEKDAPSADELREFVEAILKEKRDSPTFKKPTYSGGGL